MDKDTERTVVPADVHTVANLIDEFMPSWCDRDAFIWPPDVFAVTSVILRRTGCYRAIITDSAVTRSDPQAYDRAKEWIKWIAHSIKSDKVEETDEVRHLIDLRLSVRKHSETLTFEELRAYSDDDVDDMKSRNIGRYVKKLIELHALADEACSGFGILIGPYAETGLAHALANLLLVAGGSLATLPKRYGVVLPKFRTPADGLTMRSFSHNITHHISEVEVFWRAIPWTGIGGNKINILVAPYPREEIQDSWFNAVGEKFHITRYFQYGPPDENDTEVQESADEYLRKLIGIVKEQDNRDAYIDIVVFPELALTTERYNFFLWMLEEAKLKHMPVVVGGVREEKYNKNLNMVIVSSHLANYWYQVRQRKHHRWKLDASQLKQYELADKFAGDRDWIEHIAIGQRRLTVLAPTHRLALCTLICEDLARLEPVSEIIRGVGPNLLIALLLDGPQLSERWPARYASVFADDPGTAVLSVTAMGMASRSKKLGDPRDTKIGDADQHVVALWKDQLYGSKQLSLHKNRLAILLTLASSPTQDYTADGRGGDGHSYVLAHAQHKELPKADVLLDVTETELKTRSHKNWQDMRELSVLTYLIDACCLLGSPCDSGKKLRDEKGAWTQDGQDWIDSIIGLLEGGTLEVEDYQTPSIRKVIAVLRRNFKDPRNAGQAAPAQPTEDWHREGLTKALDLSKDWMKKLTRDNAAFDIAKLATDTAAAATKITPAEKKIITKVSTGKISQTYARDALIAMKKRRAKLVGILMLTALKSSLEQDGHRREVLRRGNKQNSSPQNAGVNYKELLGQINEGLETVNSIKVEIDILDTVFPCTRVSQAATTAPKK